MTIQVLCMNIYMYIIYIIPTIYRYMSNYMYYILQNGDTPLHIAVKNDHTTCSEHLLSTPDIDMNIMNKVRMDIKQMLYVHVGGPRGCTCT